MKMLKPAVVSVLLGVCVKTLQRWDKSGKLKARRTDVTNKRYYLQEDINKFLEGETNDKD